MQPLIHPLLLQKRTPRPPKRKRFSQGRTIYSQTWNPALPIPSEYMKHGPHRPAFGEASDFQATFPFRGHSIPFSSQPFSCQWLLFMGMLLPMPSRLTMRCLPCLPAAVTVFPLLLRQVPIHMRPCSWEPDLSKKIFSLSFVTLLYN